MQPHTWTCHEPSPGIVLATEPALFNRAQPEYDPRLRDLAPFAGSSYPLEGTDPYGGPDD